MKQLTIPYLNLDSSARNLSHVSLLLDGQEQHELSNAPWGAYPYKPFVTFSIAHSGDYILLKYYVKEKSIRAAHSAFNSSVHKDACVEFFISLQQGDGYYNLEMNCTGTILMAYGIHRNQRKYIRQEKVNKIERQVLISHTPESDDVYWELTTLLPVEVFEYHHVAALSGKDCRANFYKCGDDLPEPHFLCWSPVTSAEPDFHQPEFFGRLYFQ